MANEYQPGLINEYNYQSTQRKCFQTLHGLCAGMVADNKLTREEFDYLQSWLTQNEYYLTSWPGDMLARKVNEIISDGIVTEDELENLKDVLVSFTGTPLADEYGQMHQGATSLPVNKDAIITFDGKSFCFTGSFFYGPRSKCQAIVEARSGLISNGVKKSLHYLVIGQLGSDAWINSSYGRKIEKAIQIQQQGLPLLIVSEQMWVESLN